MSDLDIPFSELINIPKQRWERLLSKWRTEWAKFFFIDKSYQTIKRIPLKNTKDGTIVQDKTLILDTVIRIYNNICMETSPSIMSATLHRTYERNPMTLKQLIIKIDKSDQIDYSTWVSICKYLRYMFNYIQGMYDSYKTHPDLKNTSELASIKTVRDLENLFNINVNMDDIALDKYIDHQLGVLNADNQCAVGTTDYIGCMSKSSYFNVAILYLTQKYTKYCNNKCPFTVYVLNNFSAFIDKSPTHGIIPYTKDTYHIIQDAHIRVKFYLDFLSKHAHQSSKERFDTLNSLLEEASYLNSSDSQATAELVSKIKQDPFGRGFGTEVLSACEPSLVNIYNAFINSLSQFILNRCTDKAAVPILVGKFALDASGHQNLAFIRQIDEKLYSLEYYEPHGFDDVDEETEIAMRGLARDLSNALGGGRIVQFEDIATSCPIGFQSLEVQYQDTKGYNAGFCVSHSLLYLEMRLMYPTESSDTVSKHIYKIFRDSVGSESEVPRAIFNFIFKYVLRLITIVNNISNTNKLNEFECNNMYGSDPLLNAAYIYTITGNLQLHYNHSKMQKGGTARHIMYNKHKYLIRKEGNKQYITTKNTKVYLSSIRGKYKKV